MSPGDSPDPNAADPASRASVEQKIAVVNELIPYVLLMPRGPDRAEFELKIARRIGVSLAALRDEIASRERFAGNGKTDATAEGRADPRRRCRPASDG